MKQRIRILVPLLIIATLLCFTVGSYLAGAADLHIRNYAAMLLFVPLVFWFFKKPVRAVLATGLYLVLASFNLLVMAPYTSYAWVRLGSDVTNPQVPLFQWEGFLILVLYAILNFDRLVEVLLDYKESRACKKAKK